MNKTNKSQNKSVGPNFMQLVVICVCVLHQIVVWRLIDKHGGGEGEDGGEVVNRNSRSLLGAASLREARERGGERP